MDIRFDGKVAVVTGAGSGIGFACAQLLAESGAKVAMLGRNAEKIRKAAEMLGDVGDVRAYPVDVTDGDAVCRAIETIRVEMGEIDCLMQSAGGGVRLGPGKAYEEWERTMNLNATATYRLMREVVERSMLPRRSGAVVNVSSMAGIRGIMPPMSDFAYSASKAAVVSLAQQGAVLWGRDGVRVNAIAPGGVASGGVGVSDRPANAPDDPSIPYVDLIPSGRHSTVREIAAAACFLLSDWSGNTNGQVLVVDGAASVMGF